MIEVLTENFDDLTSGLWVTTRLVLGAFVVALVLGTLVAALRVQPVKPLQWLATIYTEVFRGVPLLVLLFIAFAGVRRGGVEISAVDGGHPRARASTPRPTSPRRCARACRRSPRARPRRGCRSGFTELQVLRRIVLPQAFRTVIPPLGSITIAMIKNSAIVGASIVALDDILKEARIVNSNTFQTTEAFFWGAVGYLLLTVTRRRWSSASLETRYAVRR